MRSSLKMIATAAFAIFLMPAFNLRAQVAPSATQNLAGVNTDTPKAELFLGYSYLQAVPKLADGNRLVWLNGGRTSIAVNFNRYLGLVGDFGGFGDTQLRLNGAANPSIVQDSSGSVYTYLAGPRLSYRGHGRITPFAQALFGGIHASEVTLSSGCTAAGCTPLPAENTFAMTAGGGLD